MLPIKIGFLVSYDYRLLKYSLPPVYDEADKIVLAIDKKRLTWAGNKFSIEPSFFEWVKSIDTKKKIEIYEDVFYRKGLSAIECETQERNMLAQYMGEGGWHLQIDSDEYFVSFSDFVHFLRKIEKGNRPIDVQVQWVVIFKKTSSGYLIVKNGGGYISLATTSPEYIIARRVQKMKQYFYHQRILHDSCARDEHEMITKLKNWGHNSDFDTDGYFHYWKNINEKNYMFARNIHPINPEYWQGLNHIEGTNIEDLLEHAKKYSALLMSSKPLRKIDKYVTLFTPPIVTRLLLKLRNN